MKNVKFRPLVYYTKKLIVFKQLWKLFCITFIFEFLYCRRSLITYNCMALPYGSKILRVSKHINERYNFFLIKHIVGWKIYCFMGPYNVLVECVRFIFSDIFIQIPKSNDSAAAAAILWQQAGRWRVWTATVFAFVFFNIDVVGFA